jgi:hypothetical protein
MTCEELEPLVSALVDGELDAEDTALVRGHLATCASCRALEEELAATSALVQRHAPRPKVNVVAWARFEKALKREPRRVKRGGWEGLLGAAALVVVTWGLGAFLAFGDPPIVAAWERRVLPLLKYEDPATAFVKLPPCPKDLEGVKNAGLARDLTPAQLRALERDGLVQVPGTGESLGAFYERDGALVTADAALLVWGGAVSRAVIDVERSLLAPELEETLADLDVALRHFEEKRGLEASARLARRTLDVARALEGAVSADAAVQNDVERALRGVGVSRSEVLDREIDWSRFTPRGPLRELPGHFRAVVWLGEAAFRLDEEHPDELRAACLVALGLARESRTLRRFADFDDAASLIHGPQDDLGGLEVLQVVRSAIGDSVRPELVGRPEALAPLARHAREIARSARAGALAEGGPRFRLVGDTRSLEEVVLTELSSSKLPGRPRPTSLDLLAALGSQPARAVAGADGAEGYVNALEKLTSLLEDVTKVPRAAARAGSGVERAKLFAVTKLLETPPRGVPSVMETQAYSDRLLLAGLAALDMPEPGPERGELTVDPRAALPALEPLPGFYARLAHGARRLALGLDATSPSASRATARLQRVSELLQGLADASREVLEGHPLSKDSRLALQSFASAASVYAPASAFACEDVHVLLKADGTREWLERANGPLDRLYMVVPGESGLRLAVGAAVSAREVISPRPLSAADVARAPRTDPAWASQIVR